MYTYEHYCQTNISQISGERLQDHWSSGVTMSWQWSHWFLVLLTGKQVKAGHGDETKNNARIKIKSAMTTRVTTFAGISNIIDNVHKNTVNFNF